MTTAARLLQPDTLSEILGLLPTTSVLACGCVSAAFRVLVDEYLRRSKRLDLAGSEVTPRHLRSLALIRMRGGAQAMNLSGCRRLNKQSIVQAVRDSCSLAELIACDVGVGSWTLPALLALTAASPAKLRVGGNIRIDCRLALNHDVVPGSALLLLLSALPALEVRRLVLINDRVNDRGAVPAGAAAAMLGAAMLGAAAPAAVVLTEAGPGQADAAAPVELGGGVELGGAAEGSAAIPAEGIAAGEAGAAGEEAEEAEAAAEEEEAEAAEGEEEAGAEGEEEAEAAVDESRLLYDALATALVASRSLEELDASSGALGVIGVLQLVVPLLESEACVLRRLACR
jgi:hypothetical protein